jgi:tetratricopeptide (TPR) repeat protein
MSKRTRVVLAALAVLVLSSPAWAQMWRGSGRVAGKVTDENGKPIEGVTIKLFLPEGNGGVEAKSNKKGDWSAGGIGSGNWQLDFIKEGYETRRLAVQVEQMNPKPPMEIILKKAAPDPNQIIAEQMKQAAALVTEKKYADAQALYADLLAKFPQAFQLHLSIARAYHLEGAHDKEIDHLKTYLQKDPNNVEIKLLTGSEMLQKGNPEEGKALLASVDDAQVKEAAVFVNVGINLVNQNKAKDAMPFFDRAIARFPDSPDAYYYRGISELQIGSAVRPDNPAEGDKLLAAGKADLQKFVQMAPTAPEAEAAKKLLEQLK